MKRIIIIETIFFLYVTSFCFADNIYLKNGNVIEGRVIKEEKDILLIEIEGGTITFNKNEISSIEIKDLGYPKLPEVSSDKAKPLSEGVEMNIAIENIENKMPIITGTTNLPEGTKLLISLYPSDMSHYVGQDKTIVKQGKFHGGPFSRNYNVLLDGDYLVEVIMPVARVQPQNIQAIIGAKGEHLIGPLVEESSIGKIVTASRKFVIGKSVDIETKTKEAKRLLFYLDKFKNIKFQIERMYNAALNGNQDGIENWNREYSKFKKEIKTLDDNFCIEFGENINEYSGSFYKAWFNIGISWSSLQWYLIDLNRELNPELKVGKTDIDYFELEIEKNLNIADSVLSGFK